MNVPIDEWRKTPSLVNAAKRLWKDESFRVLIEMCDAIHPKNFITQESAEIQLGQIRGYDKFRNNLELAAVPLTVDELPPPTYESSEEQEKHGKQRRTRNRRQAGT